jgi:serine/threonine protein kinase
MAPEIHLEEGNWDSYPCDIWAIGVMMFYLIQGEFPFDAPKSAEVKEKIIKDPLTFTH